MEQDYPGGRHLIRKAHELRGVPNEAMSVILSSITDSSHKQYETCFKKWWTFCAKKELDPFHGDVSIILQFLTELYNNGSAASTINCYRSAISLLVGPDIAQDSSMKRFFKGLSNLRPSKPKYDATWNPKIVLDHFSSYVDNSQLDLKSLTTKLITLLALTTGHRMQTFSLIKIENIEIRSKSIDIKIPDRIKTTGLNRSQPVLVLPYYHKNKKVCVATALRTYLDRTKENRKNIDSLFLSHKRPFKAVTSQTLSRWVKNVLEECGIDTNIFTAHSTRHASTSAASRNGIDIDTLRRTAGWTKTSNTFAKFYNLRLVEDKDAFAKAVLN